MRYFFLLALLLPCVCLAQVNNESSKPYERTLPQPGKGTDRDGECQHPDSERISIAYKTTAFGNLMYTITHKLYTCIIYCANYTEKRQKLL